jgi:hypothetical protein
MTSLGTVAERRSALAAGGDSGGPVFGGVAGQPSQLTALGVTVGAGGPRVGSCGPFTEHFFMAITHVEAALNVSVALQ